MVGVVAGAILDEKAASRAAHERELDAEIGVSGGEIGAPNLEHPPAKTGAYSGGSAGVSPSGGEVAAEGPMQTPS